jgi:hypothetical protein
MTLVYMRMYCDDRNVIALRYAVRLLEKGIGYCYHTAADCEHSDSCAHKHLECVVSAITALSSTAAVHCHYC